MRTMKAIYRQTGVVLFALLAAAAQAGSQQKENPYPSPGAGDTPETAGPLATDLSPALNPKAIAKAMRKVGDWELARARPDFSQDWTFAALYRGFSPPPTRSPRTATATPWWMWATNSIGSWGPA